MASAGPQASEAVSLPSLENQGIFGVVRATVCVGGYCLSLSPLGRPPRLCPTILSSELAPPSSLVLRGSASPTGRLAGPPKLS